MNFKDIYKSSNDSISPKRELIGTIFERTEKNKSFFMLYFKQISVCTAAAILILAISISPMLKRSIAPHNNNSEEYAKSDSNNQKHFNYESKAKDKNYTSQKTSEKDYDIDNNDVRTFDLVKKDENLPAGKNFETTNKMTNNTNATEDKNHGNQSDNKSNSVYSQNSPSETKSNSFINDDGSQHDLDSSADSVFETTINNEVDKDTSAKTKSKAVQDDAPLIKDNDVRNNSDDTPNDLYTKPARVADMSESGSPSAKTYTSAGGGGGGSISRSGTISITKEKYFEYLGLDITFITNALPDGMSFHFPENVEIIKNGNNNYTDDFICFVALDNNNPNKILSVCTTKLGGDAKLAFESAKYTKKTINTIPVAISNGASNNEAHFRLNDVWFSVTSANISLDEFNNYINSLLN